VKGILEVQDWMFGPSFFNSAIDDGAFGFFTAAFNSSRKSGSLIQSTKSPKDFGLHLTRDAITRVAPCR